MALCAAALVGCAAAADQAGSGAASASEPAPTATSRSDPTGTTTSTPTPSARTRTVRITVTGTDIEPPPGRVELPVGSSLRLVVTVDRADQLHVHGFDVEKPVAAGRPTSITLTGRDPGVYEVELHEPALLLTRLVVR